MATPQINSEVLLPLDVTLVAYRASALAGVTKLSHRAAADFTIDLFVDRRHLFTLLVPTARIAYPTLWQERFLRADPLMETRKNAPPKVSIVGHLAIGILAAR